MESFLLALSVVLPLFITMSIGYGAKRIKLIDEAGVDTINKLVFWIFLPILMFMNIYNTDLAQVFDFKLLIYAAGATFLVFVLSSVIVPLFEKDRSRCGVIIQGLLRGNVIYYGIPIFTSLIGDKYVGLMSLLIAVLGPMYNILAVIALETFRGGKARLAHLIKSILVNPLIISAVLGVLFVLFKIHIPQMLFDVLTNLSKVATPLALILLGASFTFTSSAGYIKELVTVVSFKLVLIPAVLIPAACALGFNDYEIISIFSAVAVPTGISSYSIARQMESDHVLAGQIVVYTSILAIVTIFVWTLVLKWTGIL